MGKGRERFASVTRKTVVWWDINSCPVPDGVDPGDVRARIESALPGSDFEPQEVTIFAIGNLLRVPAHHNKAISSSGIFMRHGHFGVNDIINETCWWKRNNPPPATIILITEDPNREQVYLLLSDDSSGGKYPVLSLRWENLIKETTHHDRSHMLEDSKCTLRRWRCALCWFESHTFCGFANHLYGSYHAQDLAHTEVFSEINCYQNFQNDLKREEASVRELVLEERRVQYFWLSALKNNKIAAKEITERDEGALKYLKGFKWKMVEKPPTKGLKLKFFFTKNPYFKNTVLTKAYPTIDKDEPFFAKAIGTEIEWYPGKCLTQKHKAPKKKGSKQITETEDCESFFNFFSPLQVPHSSKGLDDDTIHKWEHDYAIRCAYLTLALKVQAQLDRDKPYTVSLHGVPWFTVEADDLEMEDSDDDLVMEERTSTKKKNEIKEAFCKRSLQAQGIAVEIEGEGDEDEDEHEEEESDQGRDAQKKSSGTRNLEEVNLQRVGEKPVLISWLSAMKNGEIAAKEITERDEGALKYLKGIEWKVVEKPQTKGLKLKFFFMKNPYFKNTVLKKTYPTIDKDEPFFAKAIGTEIEWYPGKCLTQKHKVVKKKGSKQITTEDCESFFNFFSPLQVPYSSKGLDGDTIQKLEHDFAIRYALIFLALDPQGRLDHDNCYTGSDSTFAVFSHCDQVITSFCCE